MSAMILIVGALALISGVSVVFCRQTIHSALCLVLTVGLLAVIFLLLNAQFLFVVQIIIYAGAVMVLFVFIIALLAPSDEDRPRFDLRLGIGLLAVLAVTGTVVVLASNGITYQGDKFQGSQIGAVSAANPYSSFSFGYADVNNNGNVQTVAGQLFTTYVLPFEITSLLLLVAVIGAVYLTRNPKERPS